MSLQEGESPVLCKGEVLCEFNTFYIGDRNLKKFRYKSHFVVILFLWIFLGYPLSVKASCWNYYCSVEAASMAIIDVETGTILVEKNSMEKRYPASITKVMTALLTLNHLKSMDEKVVFTKEAVTAEDLESKTLWLVEGEVLSMRDCLHGLLLESANDIAKGLAIHIGGSIENFAAMMNEKAKELGCENTHFANPHGLFDENHYTCAADMAKIMAACAGNPKFVEIASTLRYTIPKTNKFEYRRFLLNDSKMLNQKSPYFYDKCCGAKTGYIVEAGKTYVAIAKDKKHKLAGVIMGTNSFEAQYKGLESLFEHCFQNFKLMDASQFPIDFALKEGDLYSKILRKDKDAKLKLVRKVKVVLPKNYDKKKVQTLVTYDACKKIKAGFNGVGTVDYYYEGKKVGSGRLYYGSYNEYNLK